MPPYKPGYNILFGTLDFFVFIKRLVMIYERFVIAKRQVAEKINEDISNPKILDLILKETKSS